MYKACLGLNYKMIIPLISYLSPYRAYKVNKFTGRIGKPLYRHTSFVFKYPAAPIGIDTLVSFLGVDHSTAETIVKNFFLLETRCEIENLWLAKRKFNLLPQIIDMDSIRTISKTIDRKGPMLLLSAHTVYYFMILWALHEMGNKIAFMMVNPRSALTSDAILQKSLIESVDSLSALIPILFTNDGNTVSRSIDLIKKGYTVMMLLDIPGYRGRGIKVNLFNNEFYVPAGCIKIYEGSCVSIASVFSYAPALDKPYSILFSSLDTYPEKIDLQIWAQGLEYVVSQWPASWIGWFGLTHMQ